ncbi:MAG: biopolymer transporter ExbD [Gammaproteobacteria bacterium]|nr:biopolymer transporter ExbD [Gammaproteobacteria bacterium]
MKFKRTIRDDPSINITPLIDVVFLLLIFFMVTTTFSRENRLLVNLPEADAEAVESQTTQIEIIVAEGGDYAVNGMALANRSIEALIGALERESGGDRNLPIILIADAEATHQSVVTAMSAIGQSGFSRLSIATQQPLSIDQI